jgi:hypothetical protein
VAVARRETKGIVVKVAVMGVLSRGRIMVLRVVVFLFLLLLISPVAYAAKRVALVVGNSPIRR